MYLSCSSNQFKIRQLRDGKLFKCNQKVRCYVLLPHKRKLYFRDSPHKEMRKRSTLNWPRHIILNTRASQTQLCFVTYDMKKNFRGHLKNRVWWKIVKRMFTTIFSLPLRQWQCDRCHNWMEIAGHRMEIAGHRKAFYTLEIRKSKSVMVTLYRSPESGFKTAA